jgi:hypothetical protein
MSEPLLTIRNHHVPGSGDPTPIDSESGNQYIGYFENAHGEQWVYVFDRVQEVATLRGGDIGWDNAVEVKDDGGAELTLGHEEQLWLYVCIEASGQIRR